MRPRSATVKANVPMRLLGLLLLALAFAPAIGGDEKAQDDKKPRSERKKKVEEQDGKTPSFAQPGSVIRGFSAPQFDAKGNLIGRIHSERAIVQADGRYRVEGIHLQGFKDGQPDYDLRLNSCLYNQDSGLVTTEDVVRLVRTNVTITGQGAVWDVANFHGRLLSNVVMVIGDIEKGMDR